MLHGNIRRKYCLAWDLARDGYLLFLKVFQDLNFHYLSLVFVANDNTSLLHVERMLRWFELASGLRVNFCKSSLVGIELDEEFTTSSPRVN